MSRYFSLTRTHSYSLLFALPLLLLYEAGAVYISRVEGSQLRNGADVLLQTLLAIGGIQGTMALALADRPEVAVHVHHDERSASFLALGLVTIALTAFVGRLPAELTATVALPHDLLHRAGTNLRLTVDSLLDRRDLRAELAALETDLAAAQQQRRFLELEIQRLEQVLEVRRMQSPGVVATAPVVGGSVGPDISRLIIGLGTRDGVTRNMPVTVPSGLVGIVSEVTPTTAVVRTVVDPQSRVGITIRGKGGQGMTVGDVANQVRVTRFTGDVEAWVRFHTGAPIVDDTADALFCVIIGTRKPQLPIYLHKLEIWMPFHPAVRHSHPRMLRLNLSDRIAGAGMTRSASGRYLFRYYRQQNQTQPDRVKRNRPPERPGSPQEVQPYAHSAGG